MWRVVNAGFSVELAADLGPVGGGGAVATAIAACRYRPFGAVPYPAELAVASGGSDRQRANRQTPAGRAGTRPAESADRVRSNRPARGRIGPAHAVEPASRLLNRPAGGAVGRSTRAAFPRPKGRGVVAQPPRVL